MITMRLFCSSELRIVWLACMGTATRLRQQTTFAVAVGSAGAQCARALVSRSSFVSCC